ncbi:hypothetical protein DLAC_08845 [Tieghemostelium lacteum]|uniref:Uncharacterized protein n=1 Tax=Tieghemostelium lacteum TaxID=361077 RepID=A0A151Z8E5_TIELA|nr:hypothetical protein DLAC_08845 [Tieghemostelium lacteum]|eukprot:KYQ90243.1 hypothetical protein DLAC_08845 [Tieghemostelium lacteum]
MLVPTINQSTPPKISYSQACNDARNQFLNNNGIIESSTITALVYYKLNRGNNNAYSINDILREPNLSEEQVRNDTTNTPSLIQLDQKSLNSLILKYSKPNNVYSLSPLGRPTTNRVDGIKPLSKIEKQIDILKQDFLRWLEDSKNKKLYQDNLILLSNIFHSNEEEIIEKHPDFDKGLMKLLTSFSKVQQYLYINSKQEKEFLKKNNINEEDLVWNAPNETIFKIFPFLNTFHPTKTTKTTKTLTSTKKTTTTTKTSTSPKKSTIKLSSPIVQSNKTQDYDELSTDEEAIHNHDNIYKSFSTGGKGKNKSKRSKKTNDSSGEGLEEETEEDDFKITKKRDPISTLIDSSQSRDNRLRRKVATEVVELPSYMDLLYRNPDDENENDIKDNYSVFIDFEQQLIELLKITTEQKPVFNNYTSMHQSMTSYLKSKTIESNPIQDPFDETLNRFEKMIKILKSIKEFESLDNSYKLQTQLDNYFKIFVQKISKEQTQLLQNDSDNDHSNN